jgi:hypothetical protein
MLRLSRHETTSFQNVTLGPRIQLSHRPVVSVAHDDEGSSTLRTASGQCETLLIVPRKVVFVISDKSIVVMDHGIRRVAVYDVARARPAHNWLEIRVPKIRASKKVGDPS